MTIFITSNSHKFDEVSALMARAGLKVKWNNTKYVEIQGNTTAEISLDSAQRLLDELDEDFFLEDTGLYIDALNGFPGPYSSYAASTIGNAGILDLLAGKERKAKFLTVVTYCREGKCHQFEGALHGNIANSISGNGGFGFDPIFIPEGLNVTLAEMDVEMKNSVSHRGQAFTDLIAFLHKNS